VPLARSDLTEVQAFGSRDAYGILFHIEVTEPMIRGMTRAFPEELRAAGVEAPAIVAEAPARLQPLNTIAGSVFGRWAGLVRQASE
jgi:hypothetical protein